MSKVFNPKGVWERFQKDERGNMALTFALTTVVVAGGMGAAMDFSTLSNAHKQSQSIADSIALSAAIYVKNNDRPPAEAADGYTPGSHKAADLGYDYKGWIDGDVSVDVVYDDSAKEARVTVTGKTVPTFMQVMGKKDMAFEATSVVSYLQIDDKFPASIALVLDNSGSMAWDDKLANDDGSSPDNAGPRIAGLQTSVNQFTTDLESRLGSELNGQRTIRMGMLPYSSDIVTANRVDMDWGYITQGEVNSMSPSGSTNSNPPMAQAKSWMDLEEAFHVAEAAQHQETYKEALKFIVFMSDGQNTLGAYEFFPSDTAPVYWKQNSSGSWSGIWATWYDGQSGYTRGHLRRTTDRLTVESCQALKDEGAQIFTIGYALEVGSYNSNSSYYSNSTSYVNLWNQTNAYNLLGSCASKPENFVKANDNEELEAAFDTIQNAIIEELIRVKS